MTFKEYRKHLRRQFERRLEERRLLDYEFMSPEWLERVKKENFLWPKQDRRLNERRHSIRRQKPRRTKNIRENSARNLVNTVDLLTPEEKQMLKDLMQQNDPE